MMQTDYEVVPDGDSLGFCLSRLASGRLPPKDHRRMLMSARRLEQQNVERVTRLWDHGYSIGLIADYIRGHPIYVEKVLRSAQRIGIYAPTE